MTQWKIKRREIKIWRKRGRGIRRKKENLHRKNSLVIPVRAWRPGHYIFLLKIPICRWSPEISQNNKSPVLVLLQKCETVPKRISSNTPSLEKTPNNCLFETACWKNHAWSSACTYSNSISYHLFTNNSTTNVNMFLTFMIHWIWSNMNNPMVLQYRTMGPSLLDGFLILPSIRPRLQASSSQK